jgi:hypothetical protein
MKKNTDLTKNAAKNDLATIDSLEISPLSDQELDAVAGGFLDNTTAASCSCCVSGATSH